MRSGGVCEALSNVVVAFVGLRACVLGMKTVGSVSAGEERRMATSVGEERSEAGGSVDGVVEGKLGIWQ